GEAPQQLAQVEGVEATAIPLEAGCVEREVRPSGQVDYDVRQRLVHGHEGVAVPFDAGAVAEGLGEGLTEGDAGVLGQVVDVDVEVTLAADAHGETPVAGQLRQQVIEEAVTGRGGLVARHEAAARVEVELDVKLGLAGVSGLAGLPSHALPHPPRSP